MNPYGGSKVAAEQVIGWQAATGALGAVTLRLFSAAGATAGRPDRNRSRIIPKVVEVAAGRDTALKVNGDGPIRPGSAPSWPGNRPGPASTNSSRISGDRQLQVDDTCAST